MHNAQLRNGTILIIVSGLCALMASLSIAFITRMRSDAQESRLVMADTSRRRVYWGSVWCGDIMCSAR